LVYHWRDYIPPGTEEASGSRIFDPKWLLALNALSLVCALVGNAALLLNMTRRLKFSTAQPITITGFFLAGVLLIADMAALTSIPAQYPSATYTEVPGSRFALTGAFYFAIFAASLYIIIGLLMCMTVHGAHKRHFPKDFNLTPAQRTLMIQTMGFVTYLLLGALVFSKVEGWRYLDAVYWADVTLLTIGMGDYSPHTAVGRGLIIPFAICGVLMVGLVVGSIRSLVLEHGKEKMVARIIEKRRESAVHNVDGRKQTIKVSWFAQADFSTDPSLSPAQRREEEFKVMRRVQKTAESERRYVALATSLSFALMLWFVGAAIFMVAERRQGWTYFESVYFAFVALLTIGYGDFTPASNAGKAFFVVWSLLAIPSLTILISDMGDTIVKWFSDIAAWLGSVTILPGPDGARVTAKSFLQRSKERCEELISTYTPFGKHGGMKHAQRMNAKEHEEQMLDLLAERLELHIEQEEFDEAMKAESEGDFLEVFLPYSYSIRTFYPVLTYDRATYTFTTSFCPASFARFKKISTHLHRNNTPGTSGSTI
jgi:potassium channel subfamily K